MKIKVLLGELTVPYLGKKFPALYGTRRVDIIERNAVLNDTNSASSFIQGVYKRMARFQKLTRNLFLILHGQNVHRQQRQLSEFLMRYQQFASHA